MWNLKTPNKQFFYRNMVSSSVRRWSEKVQKIFRYILFFEIIVKQDHKGFDFEKKNKNIEHKTF